MVSGSGVTSYGAVLPTGGAIDGRSKKLLMTTTGAAADVKHYARDELVGLGIDAVLPGLLSKPGAVVRAVAGGMMAGASPAKLCLDPAAQTPLAHLHLT
eukprot:2633512-Prymnesium_polylepis.1